MCKQCFADGGPHSSCHTQSCSISPVVQPVYSAPERLPSLGEQMRIFLAKHKEHFKDNVHVPTEMASMHYAICPDKTKHGNPMECMQCQECKVTQTSTAVANICGCNSSTDGMERTTRCQNASCAKHHQSAETINHLPCAPELVFSSFEEMTEGAATTAIHAETSKQELPFQVQASLVHSHSKALLNEAPLHVHLALPDVRGSRMEARFPAHQNIRRQVDFTCMPSQLLHSQTLHVSGQQILGMETHLHSKAVSQKLFMKSDVRDVSELQFSASAAETMSAASAGTLCLSHHRDPQGTSAALASHTDVKTNLSSLFPGMCLVVVYNYF